MFRIISGNKNIVNTLKKLLLLIFLPFFHANCMKGDQLDQMLKKQQEELKANRLYHERREQREKAAIDDLNDDIQDAESEAVKLQLLKERAQKEKMRLKLEEQRIKNGEYWFKQEAEIKKARAKVIVEKEIGAQKSERARVKAREAAKGYLAAAKADVQAKLNFVKENPKLIVGIFAGAVLSFYAAKHGTQLVAQYVGQWLSLPTLAQETSLLTYSQKCSQFILGAEQSKTKISDVKLESKLNARITRLSQSIKKTVQNDTYFRNVLFYGPPGTGKTMLAKAIAHDSGLEYIYFAASSLDQFSIESALIKLTELFEYAKRSSKKLMIIIDEAEILFANRNKKLSEKAQKMLNLILTYTGTENKNYTVFALTNRPKDIDEAFMSRCGEKIEIGAPDYEQRIEILKLYINKYIYEYIKPKPDSRGFLSKLFIKKPEFKKLKVEPGVFDSKSIELISKKLEHFVGRDISQFVLSIQAGAYASDSIVTEELVKQVLEEHIEQKKKMIEGF